MKKQTPGAVFLIVCAVLLFSGCGNNKTAAASDGEPYEVNFLYIVAAEGPNQQKVQDAVNALALKELNMKVKLIPMTFGTFMGQISMMLAANEPLDLFPNFASNFATFIDSQYIVNCADYLDHAQDAIRILGEDAYVAYVGDFLAGLGLMKERAYPAGIIVRKDIFEELGYTVDDFSVTTDNYDSFNQITEMFAKVKAKYPSMVCFDGTIIMGLETGSYMDNMGDNFGVLENYGQTTTVTNWYESEQYRKFCQIAQDWFQKGYTSADAAVNQDSGEIKIRAGNSFSFSAYIKPNTDIEKLAQTGYEVVVIPISESMKYTAAVTAVVYSIANASKDPAKAMQFLNWTYTSREFEDLINWGIEGEDWIETADGMAAYPSGVNPSNVGYHNDFGWMYPNQFAGHAWEGNPPDIWKQYELYNNSLLVSKAYGFTFDATPVINEEAQLTTVLAEYQTDLAWGVVDIDSKLREFNQALYNAGLQKVIDEKQRQLNAWLAEEGKR